MNREIKFRAWDIDSSEMLYTKENKGIDFFFDFDNSGLCLFMPKEEDFAEKREANIMQFTGFKDKKGNEIYEGDILYNGFNAKGVMKFENGAFICEFQYENKSKIENEKHKFRISNINSITEIIGNVYENPELLK